MTDREAAGDPLFSALAAIRGLLAARDALIGRMRAGAIVGSPEFNAAQDRLAERVPSLVAALDEVLKTAGEWEASSDARPLVTRKYAAECFRAAIVRALTADGGTEGAGQRSTGTSWRAATSPGEPQQCPSCGHPAHPETPMECPRCPEGYCEEPQPSRSQLRRFAAMGADAPAPDTRLAIDPAGNLKPVTAPTAAGGATGYPDRWRLEGYDTFEGEPYPLGTHKRTDGSTIDGMQSSYDSYEDARSDALRRLEDLERSQPSSSSGGQSGIQDQVRIIHPDGRRERVFPAGERD